MKNIKNEYKSFLDDIEKNIKNKEKSSKEVIKMWKFILGFILGADFAIILYAIILVGKRGDPYNE